MLPPLSCRYRSNTVLHKVELEEQLHPEQPYHDESWLSFDSRVKWLERTLRNCAPAKALVICARAETAVALSIACTCARAYAPPPFTRAFPSSSGIGRPPTLPTKSTVPRPWMCSEIGSEGRNFQFAHHLDPVRPATQSRPAGTAHRPAGPNRPAAGNPCALSSEGTAQETLLDWYDRGMNLFFGTVVPPATMILKHSRTAAAPCPAHRGVRRAAGGHRRVYRATRPGAAGGRDRLLERNSCKPEVAAALIEEIRATKQVTHWKNTGGLCEAFGVDQNSLGANPHPAPLEHMLTGHFSAHQEDGTNHLQPRQGTGRRIWNLRPGSTQWSWRPWKWCTPWSWQRRHRHHQTRRGSRRALCWKRSHRGASPADAAGGTLPAAVTDAPAGGCTRQGPGNVAPRPPETK